MYKELMDLGKRLESEGELVPFGFYSYTTPIKWIIHLWSQNPSKYHIEEAELFLPRPEFGRTVGVDQAHPAADEAGYVFGIRAGKNDKKAEKKHQAFLGLMKTMQESAEIKNTELKQALSLIENFLQKGDVKNDPNYKKMEAKDWISFVVEDGKLAGQHIFEHEETRFFWRKELSQIKAQVTGTKKDAQTVIKGECSVCGEIRPLAKNIPKVKLYKPIPLHSYNKSSFVSFFEGNDGTKKMHLGQCFKCGMTIASTLNRLRENPLNHRILMADKKDGNLNTESPRNQFAFFWLKNEEPIRSEAVEINPNDALAQLVSETLGNNVATKAEIPEPDISHLDNLLKIPWTSDKTALRINENEFCLLVLSPNKARIIVREWIHISLKKLVQNFDKFISSQRIIAPSGQECKSFPLPDMLKAVEAANLSKPPYKAAHHPNPNLMRQLLRTAYLRESPPSGLLELAVSCFRHPKIFEKPDTMHTVAAIVKMVLMFNKDKEKAEDMEKLDPNRNVRAYLCGRLLAVLEEAQLRASRWRINSTLVDRFYGSACSAPASILGTLVTRGTTDHFPKIRKNLLGHKKLGILMEDILTQIHKEGGYPTILSLKGQAEFSLGFYHQRANFRSERPKKDAQTEQGKEAAKGEEK